MPEERSEAVETTVVIPTYNYGAYVGEAIESALAQTADGVEVIVVDDGSTDGTAEVLARYAGRIRVHSQANAGVSAARNAGARLASGRYIALLDADNRLRPTFVERCAEALDANPEAGFAFTHLVQFGDVDRTLVAQPYAVERLLDRNVIDTCTLVRRELLTRHGFDEGHRTFLEDWDFWLTLAEHGWGGVLVDEALVEYRKHPASATVTRDKRAARRGRLRIMWRHRRLVGHRRVLAAAWALAREPLDSPRARASGRRARSWPPTRPARSRGAGRRSPAALGGAPR